MVFVGGSLGSNGIKAILLSPLNRSQIFHVRFVNTFMNNCWLYALSVEHAAEIEFNNDSKFQESAEKKEKKILDTRLAILPFKATPENLLLTRAVEKELVVVHQRGLKSTLMKLSTTQIFIQFGELNNCF